MYRAKFINIAKIKNTELTTELEKNNDMIDQTQNVLKKNVQFKGSLEMLLSRPAMELEGGIDRLQYPIGLKLIPSLKKKNSAIF